MDRRIWFFLLVAIPFVLIFQLELTWMKITESQQGREKEISMLSTSFTQLNSTVSKSQDATSQQLTNLINKKFQSLKEKLEEFDRMQAKRIHDLHLTLNESLSEQPLRSDPAPEVQLACGRQQDIGRLGFIHWKPRKGYYLLALCTGGQMSNRLMCIRQNMVDAAVTNRTLILPDKELDYDYSHLIDFKHFKDCFGKESLITLSDYKAMPAHNGTIHVDSLLCHLQKWHHDGFCQTLVKRFEVVLNATFTDAIEVDRPPPRFSMKVAALKKKFGDRQRVVAFANMFGVALKDAPLNSLGGGPLFTPQSCRALLQPSKPIISAALGFANTLLGKNFVAAHLRRGDFFQHCMEGDAKGRNPPCFIPIPQVAKCLMKRLQQLENTSVVFLATDADEQEIALLRQSVVDSNGRTVPMVTLPQITDQPWAKALIKEKIEKDPQVIAVLTKAICGLSGAFFGSWTSTFSGDIHRLRDWWNTSTCMDSGICLQQVVGDFVEYST